MSDLIKEVQEILATVTLSPATYRVERRWEDGFNLRKTGKPLLSHPSPITKNVEHSVQERLDLNTMKHSISTVTYQVIDDIRYSVCAYILAFLKNNQNVKNAKLTHVYRWYQEFVNTYRLKSDVQMENDMFNVYKWMVGNESKSGGVNGELAKNTVSLLDVLRARYEAKGMKL